MAAQLLSRPDHRLQQHTAVALWASLVLVRLPSGLCGLHQCQQCTITMTDVLSLCVQVISRTVHPELDLQVHDREPLQAPMGR